MRVAPWLVLLAVSLLSTRARADPVEFLRALVLHPGDPRLMVLRYESGYGGLLLSRDGGESFSLLPSSAFTKYALSGHVPIHLTSDGKLLIAMDDGLFVDDARGCGLSASGSLEKMWVVDLAPHPSDPDLLFALTMASTSADQHAGLWRRTAKDLVALGTSDPPRPPQARHPVQPTSLKVVARAGSMGGLRFVEGALLADEDDTGGTLKPVLRVSDDQGTTWTTHAIPATGDEVGLPRILAIEGADPFSALIALQRGLNTDPSAQANDAVDPILLTTDSGATFSPHNTAMRMADQALVLPGGQVLIADRGPEGGLWSAPSIGGALTKVQDYPVHCLGYRPDTETVFLCKAYELGIYDLASQSFCAFFQNREVKDLVSCPSEPLADTPKVIDQLCDKWCGPLHFSSSPVCSTLTSARAVSCVAFAREYDSDAGHVESPGENGAPRCSPPPLPVPDAASASDVNDDAAIDDGAVPSGGDRDGCGCRLARSQRTASGRSLAVAFALSAFAYRRRRSAQART